MITSLQLSRRVRAVALGRTTRRDSRTRREVVPKLVERERRSLRPRPLLLGAFEAIRPKIEGGAAVKQSVLLAQASMDEVVFPDRVQQALGQLVGTAQEGLLALSVGVGLGVLAELMEEVDEVVGRGGEAPP
jgi:hypothetical protein